MTSTLPATYESRPIKRIRRTRDAIDTIKSAMIEVIEADYPMTVRQVYYRLVSKGAIDKTEKQYKNVIRLLGLMRRSGEVPFSRIADNTRWQRKPRTYTGIEDLLEQTARLYRRSLWSNQDCYVEIWLEKDALAGVIYDVTGKYDVPLMVTRGYPSITYLHSAAEAIAAEGKPAYLYYLGDFDPSGIDIPKKVEAGIREFAPGAEVHFKRIAVNEDQISAWNLPTRPTKKTDSRSHDFIGESVEVDAIEPAMLRQIVEDSIEQHIDQNAMKILKIAEASERSWLEKFAEANQGGSN